ncbi:MAG TPA: hypothetical protein VNH11_07720 [Pirellulales bacterium]|nr:hypothetical protein [Pirellulales bacterium]
MSVSTVQPPLRDQLSALMAEARADDQHDRRGAARYPFFRRVWIEDVDAGQRDCVAFTREISMASVGLLHNVPLVPGWVTVAVPRPQAEPLRLAAEILWCRPCGEGWYLSGGLLHGVE